MRGWRGGGVIFLGGDRVNGFAEDATLADRGGVLKTENVFEESG